MSDDIQTYKYYLAGRNIGILAYDSETGLYLTPTVDDDAAIMLEYSLAAGSVTEETDNIDISDSLARALVYYVKMRLAEDIGREDFAALYRGKFYTYTSRSQNNKTGSGVRLTIPRGASVLK